MDGKFEARVRTAIKKNIASHEFHDEFFGDTSFGFKRFEILYGAVFEPKSCETMRTIIVAVKHKVVEGDNVTVFEIKEYGNGKMVAMFDGNADIDFENKKVRWHNVCYGGFTREDADKFFQKMFERMEVDTL